MVAKFDFTVKCTDDARREYPARYKIAAEWKGGGYTELKTFGFADDECLERVFRAAKARAERIRLSKGEEVGEMRVYILDPKHRDCELERAIELEQRLEGAVHCPPGGPS